MKKLNAVLEVTFTLVFGLTIQGQNTVPSTGGNAYGTGGNVSYTVGQVVYRTYNGVTGSVISGVQQPYEISIVTSVVQKGDINLVCSAYPNPVNDLLTLKVENYSNRDLSFQLLDSNGKIIENKRILDSETVISMKRFLTSLFFIKVIDGNKEIKTFKIVKN